MIPETVAVLIADIGIAAACLIQFVFYYTTGSNSAVVFSVFLIPSCVIAGYGLVVSLYGGRLRVGNQISLAIIVSYLIPTIVAGLAGRAGNALVTTQELAFAALLMSLSIFIAIPFLLIERTRRIHIPPVSLGGRNGVGAFLAIAALAQTYLIATGRFTYGALLLVATRDSDQSTALLTLVDMLSIVATPLAGLVLGLAAGGRRTASFTLGAAIAAIPCGLAWQFISGRRYFAIVLAMVGMYYVFGRFRQNGRRIRLQVLATIVGGGVVLVSLAWPAYYAMRVVSYSVRNNQAMPSLAEMLSLSRQLDQKAVQQDYEQNLQDRTTLLESYAIVTETARYAMAGEGIKLAFATALPPFLFPGDKAAYLYRTPTIETAWARVGVPFSDWANSLALDSYMDFRVFGYVVYVAIVMLAVAVFYLLVGSSPLLQVIVLNGFTFQALNGENTLTAYLVTARYLAILVILIRILGFCRWWLLSRGSALFRTPFQA